MFKQNDARRAPTWDDTDPARAEQLHAHTALDRETYTRAGFQPVDCNNCGTRAYVRKNSEKHTSIQWRDGSDQNCPVLSMWRSGEEIPDGEDTCPNMLASIRYAYAEGLITLAEGVDPVDPEHMVNPFFTPE